MPPVLPILLARGGHAAVTPRSALPGEPGQFPTEGSQKATGSCGSRCDVPSSGRWRSGLSIAALGAGLLRVCLRVPQPGELGTGRGSARPCQAPRAFQKKPTCLAEGVPVLGGGWNWMIFKVSSSPNSSMILWLTEQRWD